MRTPVLLLLLFACGGDPVLKNAPKVPVGAVAGAAAGIAGAATLADPNAAAKQQERHEAEIRQHDRHDVKEVTTVVPADVFDRLEDAGVDAR